MFNQLVMLNEQLVRGREDLFFGFEFDVFAARKLPDYAVRFYIDTLRRPDALHTSFELYRAFPITVAQNKQRAATRLTLPVLAIGGALNLGGQVGDAMKMAADDVQSLVIPGSGHWVAEEAPEEMLTALTAFLAT
jgi:pimeloyl-ACP methyl ester carboxylesterase